MDLHDGADDAAHVSAADDLTRHVMHAEAPQDLRNDRARARACPLAQLPHNDLGGVEVAGGEVLRDGAVFVSLDAHQVLLCVSQGEVDGDGLLLALAVAKTTHAVAVADDDEGGEGADAAVLDDFDVAS